MIVGSRKTRALDPKEFQLRTHFCSQLIFASPKPRMKKPITLSLAAILFPFSTFANTDAAVLKYSADKITQKEKNHTVELVGNAEVVLKDAIVRGEKIVLQVKTDGAKNSTVTGFTGPNLSVKMNAPAEKI